MKFASFLLLAGSHLFVSRLHVAGVLILILAASIREHFLFVVVLRISNIYGCLFDSLLFALVSTSGSLKILLAVVEIVFELFVEDHLVGIANVRIFISFWRLRVIGCDDAKLRIDNCGGGGVRMRMLLVLILRCLASCLF